MSSCQPEGELRIGMKKNQKNFFFFGKFTNARLLSLQPNLKTMTSKTTFLRRMKEVVHRGAL